MDMDKRKGQFLRSNGLEQRTACSPSPRPLWEEHLNHLTRFASLRRQAKTEPLTPALSPSEGERGSPRQVFGESRFMGRGQRAEPFDNFWRVGLAEALGTVLPLPEGA